MIYYLFYYYYDYWLCSDLREYLILNMIITGFSDVDICFVCIPNFYLTVLFAKIPHYFSPYHIFANVLHLYLSWCFRVSHIIISIQLVTAVCLCTICMYKKLQLIACKVLIFQIKIVISIVDSYHNPQKTSHYVAKVDRW